MQSDGNFVVYNSDSSLWSTQTDGNGNGTNLLSVQDDGNIVLYDSVQGSASYWNLWDRAGAWHDNAAYLKMQNDGNLVAYDSNETPIWWTGTTNQYGYSTFNIN